MHKMDIKKNGFYYALGIVLFGVLKVAYTYMDANDLIFILSPTNKMISFLSNSESVFLNGSGYFYHDFNILIEKSCSGFNFFILIFIIGYFVIINHFQNKKFKLIFFSILSAWVLTVFVNTSRIIIAIFIQKLTPQIQISTWFHQAQGTFVYLFFLIVFYKTLTYLLTKYFPENEKLA